MADLLDGPIADAERIMGNVDHVQPLETGAPLTPRGLLLLLVGVGTGLLAGIVAGITAAVPLFDAMDPLAAVLVGCAAGLVACVVTSISVVAALNRLVRG